MKKTVLFITLLSILTLSSCKKEELTSCIESDKSTISTGQSITFTSCSESELSYNWTIVGPEAAPENKMVWSDRIITIPFSVAGAYTITLNTYSRFSLLGDKATSTSTFTVN